MSTNCSDNEKQRATSLGNVESIIQRRSILDPHDSVMDLLNKQQLSNHKFSLEHDNQTKKQEYFFNKSLSDSWQAIDRDEYSFLNTLGELNQPFGGVLSSDTSEEEADLNQEGPSNMNNSQTNQFLSYAAPSYSDVSARGASYHEHRPGLKDRPRNHSPEDDDDETIMVNLGQSWAGSFFVMPKLSLSESMKRFKILIVGGDSARTFYHRLSRYYQPMFEVGKINNITKEDAEKFTAYMIIFSDPKKVRSTLETIWRKYGRFTLIPICQKGQKQSVTDSVKKFANANKIKLMSYPVVLSDHYEIHGLLRHLHSLYMEVDSDYETDIPKKSKHKKIKKKHATYFSRKWWFWTVSIALGVGIGCCVTLLFGNYEIHSHQDLSVDLSHIDHDTKGLIDVVEGTTPAVMDEKPPNSIPEFFGQIVKLIKDTAKQFNTAVKQFILSHMLSSNWVQSIGKDLLHPDTQSTVTKVTALDLVML